MKIRKGFVSNSSSSSFIIHLTDDRIDQLICTERIQNAAAITLFKCLTDPTNYPHETHKWNDFNPDQITNIETPYGFIEKCGSVGWYILVTGDQIHCRTPMTNFDLHEFIINECDGLYKEITDYDSDE